MELRTEHLAEQQAKARAYEEQMQVKARQHDELLRHEREKCEREKHEAQTSAGEKLTSARAAFENRPEQRTP